VSRVLIADDHAVVRVGYKQFLEADAIITEIGEASSGSDALDHLRRKEWDLLLMDIHMPDRSGLDVLKYVVNGYPDVRILIISGLPEEQFARGVLRAGASGYLFKGGSAEEFMKAVHTVLMGRRYISASLAEALAADLESPRDQNQPLHARLSAREFQIFYKLASGVGVSNIARELSLSVKTVSTYRTRIVEKMAFDSNADMTTYALRNGIIQ
jgi:two-component system, NarL family, invasion response regulator UvrY